jgi:hypothetical protein
MQRKAKEYANVDKL